MSLKEESSLNEEDSLPKEDTSPKEDSLPKDDSSPKEESSQEKKKLLKGESTWLSIKSHPVVDRLKNVKHVGISLDGTKFGKESRWEKVIPNGAKLIAYGLLQRYGVKSGEQNVVDSVDGITRSLSSWCLMLKNVTEGKKTAKSGPIDTSVVVKDVKNGGVLLLIKVKLFDYLYLEEIINEGEILRWVIEEVPKLQTSGASPTTEQSSIEEESSSSSSVVEKVQKVDEDIDVREYYHSEFGNGPALEDNDEVLESPVESRDENQSNKRSREEAFASHLLQFTSNQHSGVIVKEFTPKTQSAVSFKEIGFPRGPTEIPQQQQQVTPLPQRYYQGQFSSQKKRKSEPKQKREGFVKRHVNDQGHVVEIPVAWGPIPDASLYKKEAELPNEQKLQIWTSMYTQNDIKCTYCLDTILEVRKAFIANLAHVFPYAQGGINDKIWNYTYICGQCNMGGTLKNSNFFDAIAYSHSNRVLFFMEHCMKLYFESESELDYTFESREDFIRTVFGDDRVEGGIKSSKVFQILRQYDSAKPLEPVYLNPFRRMLFKHVQTSHW